MPKRAVQPIDIFISSPSDLIAERADLKQMLEALNDDPAFKRRYRFHPYIYEAEISPADLQGLDWQQYINLYMLHPSRAHIVIGLLWSRLGTPLPNFVNPVTGLPYRSGTEYELTTAFDANRHSGLPKVIFYQCRREIALPDDDEAARRQTQLAQSFVRELQDEQLLPAHVNTFSDASDLCRKVQADLREILPKINQRLHTGKALDLAILPALPLGFVKRGMELNHLASAIRRNSVTVLYGLPGQGKTLLARAVWNSVHGNFSGGILWATLGQQADLARLEREWIVQLQGNVRAAGDDASTHEELLRCLQGKTVLLVLDDVWQAANVEQLINALPVKCKVLITSRNAHLLSDAPMIELKPMSSIDGRELLRRASKNRVSNPAVLDMIADRLGYLALALKIVGARLARYSWDEIRAQLESQRFAEMDAGQRNFYRSLDASVQFLPADQQERYRELVIFPPDEPLVEEAVARLWQSTADLSAEATHYLLAVFQSLALIQANDVLHDLQRDYMLATTTADQRLTWHALFTASYGPPEDWGVLPDDGYAWRWLAWHLAQSGDFADLRTLLLSATYLQRKLARLQAAAVITDLRLLPNDNDLMLLSQVIVHGRDILNKAPQELANQVLGRAGAGLHARLHDWPVQSEPQLQLDSLTLLPAGGDLLSRMPHDGAVNDCCFSPDGRWALSASNDRSLRLWDVQSGTLLHTLEGHLGPVNACCFSPDGNWVLSASADATLRLWNAQTGTLQRPMKGHWSNLADTCCFSPDGRWVLSTSRDNTLSLWDAQTGRGRRNFREHSGLVSAYGFSPDGRRIVSASFDKTVRLWDAQTGAELHILHGHTRAVNAASFSPDGRRIVSTSYDRTVRLWEAQTGAELHILQGHRRKVITASFSPDGRRVVSASADSTLRLWDAQTGAELHILQGHTAEVVGCSFSADGRWVLSASNDKTLRLWDVESGDLIHTLEGHTGKVNASCFSPNGSMVLSASEDHTLRLWDAQGVGGAPAAEPGHAAAVRACNFSPDGHWAVSASNDKTLRLWDAQTGKIRHTLQGHDLKVYDSRFSPDGSRVLSASADTTLRLWDAKTGALISILRGHTEGVYACHFSPDGRWVLSASADTTLRLWDAQTGALRCILEGHAAAVRACHFSPDGIWVLSASNDKTLRLWDAQTGEVRHILQGHTGQVNAGCFSPDGRWVLSASNDKTPRLWDVLTGEVRHILQGHTSQVNACYFDPDGRWALSAAIDGTLRLWDVLTGEVLHILQGHTGEVNAAAFSVDGQRVLSVGDDQTLRLWDAQTGQELSRWLADNTLQCLAISEESIIVGGGDGGVHFLSIRSPQPVSPESAPLSFEPIPSLPVRHRHWWQIFGKR